MPSIIDPYKDEVIRLYHTPLSTVDVALRFEVNPETIRLALKRWGIPRHPQKNLPRPQPKKARVGSENRFWSGGRSIDKDGYVLLFAPEHQALHGRKKNTIREHRMVMEKTVGRALNPMEVVHHKDGNKQNNAPENLALYPDNATHLAETLLGKCPNWSMEGYEKMLQSAQRRATIKVATQTALEIYAQAHNTTVARLRRSLSRGDTTLLQMAAVLGRLESLEELRPKRDEVRRAWQGLRLGYKSVQTDRSVEYLP